MKNVIRYYVLTTMDRHIDGQVDGEMNIMGI